MVSQKLPLVNILLLPLKTPIPDILAPSLMVSEVLPNLIIGLTLVEVFKRELVLGRQLKAYIQNSSPINLLLICIKGEVCKDLLATLITHTVPFALFIFYGLEFATVMKVEEIAKLFNLVSNFKTKSLGRIGSNFAGIPNIFKCPAKLYYLFWAEALTGNIKWLYEF